MPKLLSFLDHFLGELQNLYSLVDSIMADSRQGTNSPKCPTRWIFTGLRSIDTGGQDEVKLSDGLFVVRPNNYLLSALPDHTLNRQEYDNAGRIGHYLIYRYDSPYWMDGPDHQHKGEETFHDAVMAFQILKPVETQGFTFSGTDRGGFRFDLDTVEDGRPTNPGRWARMRVFDHEFLDKVPLTIQKVRAVMAGQSAERKNAIILLQLGLEINSFHNLIAGLLWVMGMEAIFDSKDRYDFERKLCACLGPTTQAFPDWNSPTVSPLAYTVKDMAIPIYMLRNKLAHGADLRTAASDKTTPVDLTKKVKLVDGLEDLPNAYLLSEAACYLLCQVLQKTI